MHESVLRGHDSRLTLELRGTCMSTLWMNDFFMVQGNILLAGHANGEVNLWEFKRTGCEAVKVIKDAHASAVTSATFVEGSAQLALTADAKGRLVSHNVTAYLSITSIFAGMNRTAASSCLRSLQERMYVD